MTATSLPRDSTQASAPRSQPSIQSLSPGLPQCLPPPPPRPRIHHRSQRPRACGAVAARRGPHVTQRQRQLGGWRVGVQSRPGVLPHGIRPHPLLYGCVQGHQPSTAQGHQPSHQVAAAARRRAGCQKPDGSAGAGAGVALASWAHPWLFSCLLRACVMPLDATITVPYCQHYPSLYAPY
jgi:hypothetical protein